MDHMDRLLSALLVCLLVGWTAAYADETKLEASFPDALASEKRESSAPREFQDRWIARDKALHLGASAAIVGLVYHSYHCQFRNPESDSRVLAVSVSTGCGIGKELWDLRKSPRGLSWKDLVANGVGVLLGVLLFTL